MTDTTLAPVPRASGFPRLAQFLARLLVWRHSLLFALVAASAASVVLISGGLFFAIDHLVSQQFEAVRAERMARVGAQVRATVARELDALRNLGELLGNDVELNNATYYHLYLDGELEHPTAALGRIVTAFHLDAARLWDNAGRLVVAAGAATSVAPPADPERGGARLLWVDGRPWLTASQPLTRAGNILATLWLGRPLETVLSQIFPAGGELSVAVVRPDLPARGLRVGLEEVAGQPVWLDVSVDDNVGRALAGVKRLLAWLLPVAGLVLAGLLGWVLHRQLQPLAALTRAVSAVGRGEFTPIEAGPGRNEIAELVEAYNAMTGDLAKLRDMERQVQQQERLSAIGRMAARVAHDINNPLSVIRGVAELMEQQAARVRDGERLEDSRLILHHIERCMRTVEHLLAYGQPLRLHVEPLGLDAFCREVAGRWQRQHPGLAIHLTASDGSLTASADPYQLERVLDNLLANAWDAYPPGPIEIRLEKHGDQAAIRVRDHGPGFSEDARRHLFEPFHTTKRGGNGLGLASCLAILRAHGGDLAIGPGPGGEVVATLPVQAQRPGR